jgi:predicted ATPase with chaperone activity
MIDEPQLTEAKARQKLTGESLAETVVALGLISREEIDALLTGPPIAPDTLDETGLDLQFLLNLLLKLIYVHGTETAPEIAEELCLPRTVVEPILDSAVKKRLMEILGLTRERFPVYRYTLTTLGREWATDALEVCQYVGAAPVPLNRYRDQVLKQSITNETVRAEALERCMSHLVLPETTIRRLGPALNSGKAILLYGGVGNGKTSIAEALGEAFEQPVFVPHCIEVDGQIIKIFDPSVHVEFEEAPVESEPEREQQSPESPKSTESTEASPAASEAEDEGSIFRRNAGVDPRWVRCRRPVIISGGELTLEMLDLRFDAVSKYYEAPAHFKACGGVFILDDFGRQQVRPRDLLNRWIIPLERRVDYLTLHTGKKLQMPFDELVVFSTNFPPHELMDDAALRRIPYKFYTASPSEEAYTQIFQKLCDALEIELPKDVISYMLTVFYPESRMPMSCAHPKFILDHVLERCRFEGIEPQVTVGLVREAVENMIVHEDPKRI